jgi:osmotically-inducible protein OsmY
MANPYISDPKDVELEAAVSRAVRELGLGIHVSVKGGHVTVSGIVDDFETKRDIMAVVRGVAGGYPITNNVRVARVAD